LLKLSNIQELEIIRNLFNVIVGTSILENKETKTYSKEINQFFNKLYEFKFISIIKYTEEIRQFHLLYILSLLFLDFNENELKLDSDFFKDKIYYPNIMDLIINNFSFCKNLIKKQIREAYKQINESNNEVVEFYLVFYNTEPAIIQNDIISIFIKGLFLEEDPINLKDISVYYLSIFKFILYSYFKNKTSNILSFELDPSILEDDSAMNSRYKIYEKGLRITHIQYLCKGSETLSRISDNYDILKNSLLQEKQVISENYLQRKYHDVVDGSVVKDNKLLVLKSNSDGYNLSKISQKLPLIYKLLRSVYIESKSSNLLESDKKVIYDTIYEVVYGKFKERLKDPDLYIASQSISIALTNGLTKGTFVDPFTMTQTNVSGCVFARELKVFLNILFQGLNFNEK
jgi:hypothetical protein